MNVDLVPIGMHVHERATQKRSERTEWIETRSSKHRLACARAAPCGGERRAGSRTIAAACGISEAGNGRCSVTHQACGVDETCGVDAGVQMGLASAMLILKPNNICLLKLHCILSRCEICKLKIIL
jgi:hypothetical protein